MRHQGGRGHGGTPLFHASGSAIRMSALAIRLMARMRRGVTETWPGGWAGATLGR
jgi:hypothetical protein